MIKIQPFITSSKKMRSFLSKIIFQTFHWMMLKQKKNVLAFFLLKRYSFFSIFRSIQQRWCNKLSVNKIVEVSYLKCHPQTDFYENLSRFICVKALSSIRLKNHFNLELDFHGDQNSKIRQIRDEKVILTRCY